ncbi:MAG: DUF1122 family protein [Actinomycetota bacterium]|nr:DUF1122 family protein [Actinomycetota bacterium]
MRFLDRQRGRTAGEERVVIATDDGRPAAHGLWFAGRPAAGLRRWADLVVTNLDVLPEVARELGPGASVMVAYEGDDTERALRRRVPPAATPLGLAMLAAGSRWFKDWYYPEGGREGGTKLQGTLPLDDRRREQAEAALMTELEAFLQRQGVDEADRKRAREALHLLRSGT